MAIVYPLINIKQGFLCGFCANGYLKNGKSGVNVASHVWSSNWLIGVFVTLTLIKCGKSSTERWSWVFNDLYMLSPQHNTWSRSFNVQYERSLIFDQNIEKKINYMHTDAHVFWCVFKAIISLIKTANDRFCNTISLHYYRNATSAPL